MSLTAAAALLADRGYKCSSSAFTWDGPRYTLRERRRTYTESHRVQDPLDIASGCVRPQPSRASAASYRGCHRPCVQTRCFRRGYPYPQAPDLFEFDSKDCGTAAVAHELVTHLG